TCIRAVGKEATLIINGLSLLSTTIFIPDNLITSCRRFLRSLMLPKRGIRIRISNPFSCIAWGSWRVISEILLISRKGDISCVTNNIFVFAIFDYFYFIYLTPLDWVYKGTNNI